MKGTTQRNIAFTLMSKASIEEQGNSHLKKLAQQFGLTYTTHENSHWMLELVSEGAPAIQHSEDELSFSLDIPKTEKHHDRYLDVNIFAQSLSIQSDYAGSIPIYFTLEAKECFSNVLPAVTIQLQARALDPCRTRAFLATGHVIGSQANLKGIKISQPDAVLEYTAGNPESLQETALGSVVRCPPNNDVSSARCANELFELNRRLVTSSLAPYDEIILPLSSGYDSRMIFAVAVNDPLLKKKLKCFTYGHEHSVEVVAAEKMCKQHNIFWRHIKLDCEFLNLGTLTTILDIFGDSLHVHGMYQLEFWRKIQPYLQTNNYCLTSGFMTGVPAGQHTEIIDVNEPSAFAQYQVFAQTFDPSEYNPLLELTPEDKATLDTELRRGTESLASEPYFRDTLVDVWNRQRHFIGYYPRTFEWLTPVVSPHMTPEYINFFFSMPEHLFRRRKAVELMFQHHYPDLATIISNSQGLGTMTGGLSDLKIFMSRVLAKLGLRQLLPAQLRNEYMDFDRLAIANNRKEFSYPINEPTITDSMWQELSPLAAELHIKLMREYRERDYMMLTRLQALAGSLQE